MTENALKCKYNGGTKPIGYVIDEDQHFQIDPLKVPFVPEAFKRYFEGATMTEIKDWLNNRDIRHTRNQLMTFRLHRFRKLDAEKTEHRKMLIDTFVNAIYLYDDKLLVTFNFKDGTKRFLLKRPELSKKRQNPVRI